MGAKLSFGTPKTQTQNFLKNKLVKCNLTWEKQIDSVCLNITRRIALLKLLSKYVNKPGLKQYYNSYILPIFDYGCLILTLKTPKTCSKNYIESRYFNSFRKYVYRVAVALFS